jgi:hypothetical protein
MFEQREDDSKQFTSNGEQRFNMGFALGFELIVAVTEVWVIHHRSPGSTIQPFAKILELPWFDGHLSA